MKHGGKQKTKSGAKKRIKVRKSGTIMVQKSCRNHLLSNKSKKQKGLFPDGMPVHPTRLQAVRRVMPGSVAGKRKMKRVENEEASAK